MESRSMEGKPHPRQSEIYRSMTPAQRVKVACGLHDFAHRRVIASLKALHPEKTPEEILLMAAERFLDESAAVLRKSPRSAGRP
jgi:hypothetical protein